MLLMLLYKIYSDPILNSFENLYNLLDNNTLLKETCKYISSTKCHIPDLIIDYNDTTIDEMMIIGLYGDFMEFFYHYNDDNNTSQNIQTRMFYNKFVWSATDFNKELVETMGKFVSDYIKKIDNKILNIFVDVFADIDCIDNSVKSKENEFVDVLRKYLECSPDVSINTIDATLKSYLKNDRSYNFFYEDEMSLKTYCYLLPKGTNFLFDLIFKDTEYEEIYKKFEKNTEDIEDHFVEHVLYKLHSDDFYLKKFICLIVDPSIKFSNDEIFLFYDTVRLLFNQETFLSLYANKIKFSDIRNKKMKSNFIIPSLVRYSKNIDRPISALRKLLKLQLNNELDILSYRFSVDDVYRILLKRINDLFGNNLYLEIRKYLADDKYKSLIRSFIKNIFKVLKNKTRFYIKMCYRLYDADSYKYFIDDFNRIGLRMNNYNGLKKEFKYIKKRSPVPLKSPVFVKHDSLTCDISVLTFLSNIYN